MEAPCWFPDELAHAGDEHLDPEYVLGYDRKAGVDPTEDVALLRNLGLNETHTLVDLGAGTGTLALERIASMLRAGGALRLHDLIFSFDPRDAKHIIEAWLASAVEQPERGWTRAEAEKDVREEHITFSWLLEPMLERAGFAIEDVRHHASRCYSAYTCVKAR